ncbi:MAG: hypothetical protein H6811_00985 [Phycisphaeraceae bacterium]|nr:hypothetical protein [Phycisphaeraceae bacterium]
MSDPARRSSIVPTLGWAAYLACSWTWCIGMFLPALLIRDYGVAGLVVFLLPNCLGAAAMGWVLTRSARIVERHRAAVIAFSLVTIGFHTVWIGWMLRRWGHTIDSPLTIALLAAAVAAVAGAMLLRADRRIIAFGVWLVSLGLLAWSATLPDVPSSPLAGAFDTSALWLAPVCLFGFLLCPYLDATFLHAHARSPSPKAAFTVGFLLLFPVMILFTVLYAPAIVGESGAAGPGPRFYTLVYAHWLIQLTLTTLLHAERASKASPRGATTRSLVIGASVIVLLVIAGASLDAPAGESVYRSIMGFYGLVFPAYVLIAMIPTRDGHAGLAGPCGRRKRLTLAFGIGAALPMFWMGFVQRREPMLIPGLAAVLLARISLPGGTWFPNRRLDRARLEA